LYYCDQTMENPFNILSPDWKHIPNVRACTILAVSPGGERITFSGDNEPALKSKEYLAQWTGLPGIHWLHQVHGDTVLELPGSPENTADGQITSKPEVICAVRTADCLPVVFATIAGKRVAVAHAGWRGLNKGILLRTIEALHENPKNKVAWIGPAIAQNSYETGPEVRSAFIETDPGANPFFKPGKGDRYFADLAGIARFQMESRGIPSHHISGGIWDTFTGNEFHSFRRDGEHSGRMVTIVWMTE